MTYNEYGDSLCPHCGYWSHAVISHSEIVESLNKEIELRKELIRIYEEVLELIVNLNGPLTGEDATCFRTWAEEALEVKNNVTEMITEET